MTSLLSKPIIIFVPGAWHGPSAFAEVSSLLQAAGYQTASIALPSVGRTPAISSFDPDVEAIRHAVRDALNQGQDVVMVFHSYGGMPGNEALKGLGKAEREKAGEATGVARLVHMCSFVVPEGRNMMDNMGGNLMPWIKHEGDCLYANNSRDIFYNDLDSATANYWTERLASHSEPSFRSRLTYAAWRDIPGTYIYCTRDAAIPLWLQEAMVKEVTEQGGELDTVTLDAGHSPFLSKPKETADAIRRAAGESGLVMQAVDAVNNVRGIVS